METAGKSGMKILSNFSTPELLCFEEFKKLF